MLTAEQKEFLDKCKLAASTSGTAFPTMVACEAALESAWGKSGLAQEDNNLFGVKQHLHPEYPTANLPTKEFEKGEWTECIAHWVRYPDWASCFADRNKTLTRLAHVYPHYANALSASTAENYIREVSKTWSTDPHRADKVLDIYHQYVNS